MNKTLSTLAAATVIAGSAAAQPASITATSEAFFNAMNAGQPEAILATLAPDVVTYEPVGTPPNEGHEGVMAWLQGNAAMGLQRFTVEIDAMYPAGNENIVIWTSTFVLADGREVVLNGADLHRFNQAGLIVEIRGYFDPSPVMAALAGN